MSLSVSSLHPQTVARPLLTLSVAVLGFIVLLPLPAQAKAFGDVVVERGETVPEVSTAVGDVTVDGFVEGDVHSGLGDIVVNGEVEDDVNAGFGDIEVYGPVGGEVDAGFGDVYVDAPVRGDVDVGRGNVHLGPEARVGGDVKFGSGKLIEEPGAYVAGERMFGMRPDVDREPGGFGVPGFIGWVFATAVFVACSVLVAVLAPGPLLGAARRAEEAPGWSLLLGVASVPAVVVLCVVLAVSIIGIPLAAALAAAYLVLLFFGALVAAYFVGRRVVLATGRYHAGNALASAVGAIIVAAVYLIPVLGGLLLYGLTLFGTGAAVLALFSRRRPRATYASSYEEYVRDRRDA